MVRACTTNTILYPAICVRDVEWCLLLPPSLPRYQSLFVQLLPPFIFISDACSAPSFARSVVFLFLFCFSFDVSYSFCTRVCSFSLHSHSHYTHTYTHLFPCSRNRHKYTRNRVVSCDFLPKPVENRCRMNGMDCDCLRVSICVLCNGVDCI